METNNWSERHCAVSLDATIRWPNASGFEHRQYSFGRGENRFANWSAYCMSKFALEGFSQSVREELRERRIRVINIYPAATNTGIWDAVAGDWPREKMISPGQVADAVAFAISQPSDVLVENVTLRKLTGNL